MMDLKDYLPFHLGCQMLYVGDGKPIEWLGENPILTIHNLEVIASTNQRKPLLRPLSDITREESKDLWLLKMGKGHDGTEYEEWQEIDYHKQAVSSYTPKQFAYLLSKQFDVFGLIEAGLAINKTTFTINGIR